MDRRTELAGLKQQLYDNSSSSQIEAVVKYATLSVDAIKEQLLTCPAQDVEKLQGKAEGYLDLIRAATEQPIKYA